MKEKPSTKFAFPQPHLSPAEINSLIAEAVPSGQVDKPNPARIEELKPGDDNKVPATSTAARAGNRGRRPSRNPNAHRIQIDIDARLIKAAKLKAVEDGTTFASIVEHALTSYLNW